MFKNENNWTKTVMNNLTTINMSKQSSRLRRDIPNAAVWKKIKPKQKASLLLKYLRSLNKNARTWEGIIRSKNKM